MRGSILQVNQALQATFATDSRVSFFPIGHLFVEEDGSINPDIMPDYLHLSKQGYQIWADAITPHVLCEKVVD
jgi:lysophospholipase L1-like esterase